MIEDQNRKGSSKTTAVPTKETNKKNVEFFKTFCRHFLWKKSLSYISCFLPHDATHTSSRLRAHAHCHGLRFIIFNVWYSSSLCC